MHERKKYKHEDVNLKLEEFDKNNEFEYAVIFSRNIPEWIEKNKILLQKYEIIYDDGENKIGRV